MEGLIASYLNAEYFVESFDDPIRIGKPSRSADEVLKRTKKAAWSYITAFNPLSVELSVDENLARNEMLRDDLSEYEVLEGAACDPGGEWGPENSFLVVGISLREAKRLGRKYAQRAVLFGRRGEAAELIETLFSAGNRELLRLKKKAFFCSRTVPPEERERCLGWAASQREAQTCVISGFHSAIEKDVLRDLLNGGQPIIQVLARGLKRRVEPELAAALNDGRILVITPFGENWRRASAAAAAIRNELIIDLADDVFFGHINDSGLLGALIEASGKRVNFI